MEFILGVDDLSCSACSKRLPETRWLVNNRNLLLTILEAGCPRSKHQQIWGLVRAHCLVHRWPSFQCLHRAEGARELSGVSFIRALIPFMKDLLSWPTHHSKAPPPNAITLAVRISAWEFWWGGGGTQTFSVKHRCKLYCGNSSKVVGRNFTVAKSLLFMWSGTILILTKLKG